MAFSVAACLLVLSGGYLYLFGRVNSDPQRFMPEQADDLPAPVRDHARASSSVAPILARITGGDAKARAKASRHLAKALVRRDAIARVANGEETLSGALPQRLLPYRYLLSPDVSSRTFSRSSLAAAFRARLEEFSSPLGPPARERIAADPTGEIQALRARLGGAGGVPTRHGVWVSPDTASALLLITPADVGESLDRQAAVIDGIRGTFQRVAGGKPLHLRMTGPMIFSVHSREVISTEVRRVTLLAGGFMVCLLLLAFRSPRVLLLVGLPFAAAVIVGAATVSVIFGALHGIVLAFGCTMVGVVVDYPLHLFSHLRGAEHPEGTMRRIWPTIRMGVATTIMGYSAMMLAELRGLVELAVFASSGLASAALVTRFVLPYAIPRGGCTARGRRAWRWLSRGRPPWGRSLVALSGAVALLLLLSQDDALWQEDLNRISPVPESMQRLDASLRAAMGVPDLRYLALIEGDSEQAVLERSERLAAELEPLVRSGVLERVDHPASLIPSAATQLRRQAALPPTSVLAPRVREVATAVGFRAQAFTAFVEDVAQARDYAPLTPADVREMGFGNLIDRQLFAADGRWWGLVRFRNVTEPEALHAAFSADAPQGVTFIDLKRRAERLLANAVESALRHLLLGLVAILVVLAVALKSPRRALAVAAPAVLAALCAAAVLVTTGSPLNVIHLASLLLVVGLGLDYALFFDRVDPTGGEWMATRRALLLCGASTVGVFSILAASSVTVLADIGATVTLGTLLALAFGWLCSGRRVEGTADPPPE